MVIVAVVVLDGTGDAGGCNIGPDSIQYCTCNVPLECTLKCAFNAILNVLT